MGEPLTVILEDPKVRGNLRNTLIELQADGTLGQVPAQLKWMASVDTDAGGLDATELSALYRFMRLLAETNQPMNCTIDLLITDFTISLGNMAVVILELIADWDPNVVVDTTSFLSDVINFPLSEWLIYEIADTGICPVMNEQMLDDVQAINVLQEEEAYDLLVFFIALLDDLEEGDESRIPELANLATALHEEGLIPPTEEAIRDLGTEPLVGDIIDYIPVLVDPASHGIAAGAESPVNLGDAADLLIWFLSDEGWDRLEPFLPVVRDNEATWTALDHAALLLTNEQSQLVSGSGLLPLFLDLDPELSILHTMAPLISDDTLGFSVLSILETPEVVTPLFATSGDREVPLAFLPRLMVDGTLDDLLQIADILLDAVEGEDNEGDSEL
jgi:hypothetical protein